MFFINIYSSCFFNILRILMYHSIYRHKSKESKNYILLLLLLFTTILNSACIVHSVLVNNVLKSLLYIDSQLQ